MRKAISIFTALLLISICACSRRDSVSGWADCTTTVQALTRRLDSIMDAGAAPDALVPLIEDLRKEAENVSDSSACKVVESRAAYYESMRLKELDCYDEAADEIEKAIASVDSMSHPYDYHRMTLLRNSISIRLDKYVPFTKMVENVDYFQKIADGPNEGRALQCVGALLAKNQRGGEALPYFDRAKDIFYRHGLQWDIDAVRISEMLVYHHLNDSTRCDSLIAECVRRVRADSSVNRRNSVFINSFIITADARYLYEGYGLAKRYAVNDRVLAAYESFLAGYYYKYNEVDSALHYSRLAALRMPNVTDWRSRSGIYTNNAVGDVLENNYEKAYNDVLHAWHADMMARRQEEPSDLLNQLTTYQLNEMEAEKRREREHNLIIFAGVALGFLVMIALLMFDRYSRRKRAAIEAERAKAAEAIRQLEYEQSQRRTAAMALAAEQGDELIVRLNDYIQTLSSRGELNSQAARVLQNELRSFSQSKGEISAFQEEFEKTNPGFIKRLRERWPALSEPQVKLAVYISMGMSNKQIESMLNVKSESLHQARWRLRKRMNLPDGITIEDAIREIY